MIKTLCKTIIGKVKANKVYAAIVAIAVVVAMLATMFPVHIETGNPSNAVLNIGTGHYRIVIGNQVNAQAANYTCDGVNDDVEFQAALDALPAIGGELFILAGTYVWNNAVTVTRAIDNVSVIGVGASVLLTGDSSTALFTAGGDRWVFSNLQTDAGGLEMGATSDWMWLNIFIDGVFYSVEAPDDPLGGIITQLNDIGDVNVPTPTTQYILYWDGTASKWQAQDISNYDLADLGTKVLNDLDNVATSPGDQYLLYWDNGTSSWKAQALSSYDLSDLGTKVLNDLDDLDVGTPSDQYLLYWDNGASKWKAQAISSYNLSDLGTKILNDLDDLDVGTPTDQYIVYWDNGAGKWKAQAISNYTLADLGGAAFDDLDDVDVPTPTNGYVVAWNSTSSTWVCVSLDNYDLSDLGTKELNDLDNVNTTETDGWYIYWDAGLSSWKSKALAIGDIPDLQDLLTGHADATTGVHGVWIEYQGRRLSIFNPYQSASNRYKVQLHTHTTESDGADTPAALMAAYEAAGYDAVAITDHNILTADPGGHGILYIPGVEEGSSAHMLNLFATAARWDTDLATTLGKILLDGALAAPAHAWWTGVPISTPTLQNLLGFHLLEIVNHQVSPVYDDSQFLSLLTGNKNISAIGSDDCHNIAGADFNKCFVEIMADELSLSALKESLRDGNFYVRQTGAPQLTITISGNTITCAMGAASNIEWIGRDGLVLKSEDNVVTSDYAIKGWEGFVLARVIDYATEAFRSWTQPISILSLSSMSTIESDHALRHKWLGDDELNIKDAFMYLNPTYMKGWENIDGFTASHTNSGAFTTGFGKGLLSTGATINSRACIYETSGIDVYTTSELYYTRFSLRINQFTASVIPKVAWFGLLESPTAPTATQRHIAFKIDGIDIYASCGDGTNGNLEDTGVNIGQYVTKDLYFKQIGTNIYFYVDGVHKVTLPTYAPTGWGTAKATLYLLNSTAETSTFKIFPLKMLSGAD